MPAIAMVDGEDTGMRAPAAMDDLRGRAGAGRFLDARGEGAADAHRIDDLLPASRRASRPTATAAPNEPISERGVIAALEEAIAADEAEADHHLVADGHRRGDRLAQRQLRSSATASTAGMTVEPGRASDEAVLVVHLQRLAERAVDQCGRSSGRTFVVPDAEQRRASSAAPLRAEACRAACPLSSFGIGAGDARRRSSRRCARGPPPAPRPVWRRAAIAGREFGKGLRQASCQSSLCSSAVADWFSRDLLQRGAELGAPASRFVVELADDVPIPLDGFLGDARGRRGRGTSPAALRPEIGFLASGRGDTAASCVYALAVLHGDGDAHARISSGPMRVEVGIDHRT